MRENELYTRCQELEAIIKFTAGKIGILNSNSTNKYLAMNLVKYIQELEVLEKAGVDKRIK